MSSLTEQERIGLEEVFLSISSARESRSRLRSLKKMVQGFKRFSSLDLGLQKPAKLLNMVLKRIKFSNFHHLIPKKNKKKKNLS